MPNHRYEPISTADQDENFSLKDLSSSNDIPSYFSGTPTSAPPSFRSRTNSFNEVEQPVPLGAIVPGTVNNSTDSTGTAAWTSSSSVSQTEMIGQLLARIEKLEAEAIADRNEIEDVEKTALPRRRKQDRCCGDNVVAMVFGTLLLVAVMLCVIAIVWIDAWKLRGPSNCGAPPR